MCIKPRTNQILTILLSIQNFQLKIILQIQYVSSFNINQFNMNRVDSFQNNNKIYSKDSSRQIQSQSQVNIYLQSLFQAYLVEGPSWKLISDLIPHIKNPKNLINNGLRRAARTLSDLEMEIYCIKRRQVTKELILSMLEIVNQLHRQIKSHNLSINPASKLFKFREAIIRLALWQNSLSYSEMTDLIRSIKQINLRLRSLGIFKVKNRKNWKITDKALRLVLSFDNIVQEQEIRFWLGEKIQQKSSLINMSSEVEVSSISYMDWPFDLDRSGEDFADWQSKQNQMINWDDRSQQFSYWTSFNNNI